jgi:DNA modification methylase
MNDRDDIDPANLLPHPLADLLPLLVGEDFDALVEDIRQHVLRVPITLFQGRVLDGRNRLRACLQAGVKPRFEIFDGDEDDALAYVLSLNVARRHLTTAQKAVLALKLLPMEEEKARRRMEAGVALDPPQNSAQGSSPGAGEATALAGRKVGVSKETVRQARRIAEHAPDVVDAMISGVVRSMPEAQRLAHTPASLRPAVVQHLRKNGGRVSKALLAVRKEDQQDREDQPKPEPVHLEESGGVKLLLYGCHVLDGLRELQDESVHCVITSPPYWGGLRDYGTPPVVWSGDPACDHQWGEAGPPHHPRAVGAGAGQGAGTGRLCNVCGAWRGHLGHEPTVAMYVQHITKIFSELRRVLRPEGTAWLVLGDSYITPQSAHGPFKPKDLALVPHRVAIALQDAGWWVRQDIVWHKVNPLPEPVTSRPTRAHEYVFLLAKSRNYFYDHEAIREPFTDLQTKTDKRLRERETGGRRDGHTRPHGIDPRPHSGGRNKRSVWTLPTQPYADAHFAAMPEALIEPMILAGTSAAGACAACGAPWTRRTTKTGKEVAGGGEGHTEAYGDAARGGRATRQAGTQAKGSAGQGFTVSTKETMGWRPTCQCGSTEVVPCTVLDPFSGSGTTGKVALEHGRSYVGLDLSREYLELARRRLGLDDE